MSVEKQKVARWYFGGLASAGAACVTHPLDLLKVHLQTQQESKASVIQATTNVIRRYGFLSLYNGLSASLCRQLSYSTTRFGIYELASETVISSRKPMTWSLVGRHAQTCPLAEAEPFIQVLKQSESLSKKQDSFLVKVVMAGGAGAAGGLIGTPADLVNVRMQNDMKLPPEQRRNYKHAIDGLWRVYSEEGLKRMFGGASAATSRAVFMTIGQLSCYDQFKSFLISTPYFIDNSTTHFTASLMAGGVATTLTQPLDVLKTRAMNAKPGEFNGLWDLALYTAKLGPLGFFKGYVPAFVRLAPQTILTFVFMEQLRLNFGLIKGT